VFRSQCEIPQTSKKKIERQVRFLAAQESRRDPRFFYSTMDTCGFASVRSGKPIVRHSARLTTVVFFEPMISGIFA
jgi:hypothetical protein